MTSRSKAKIREPTTCSEYHARNGGAKKRTIMKQSCLPFDRGKLRSITFPADPTRKRGSLTMLRIFGPRLHIGN